MTDSSAIDYDALADDRLDELISDTQWSDLCATHGPALAIAFQAAQDRRAAVAALPRADIPSDLRSRLLPPAPPATIIRFPWRALTAVAAAAVLVVSITLLPHDDAPSPEGSAPQFARSESTQASQDDERTALNAAVPERKSEDAGRQFRRTSSPRTPLDGAEQAAQGGAQADGFAWAEDLAQAKGVRKADEVAEADSLMEAGDLAMQRGGEQIAPNQTADRLRLADDQRTTPDVGVTGNTVAEPSVSTTADQKDSDTIVIAALEKERREAVTPKRSVRAPQTMGTAVAPQPHAIALVWKASEPAKVPVADAAIAFAVQEPPLGIATAAAEEAGPNTDVASRAAAPAAAKVAPPPLPTEQALAGPETTEVAQAQQAAAPAAAPAMQAQPTESRDDLSKKPLEKPGEQSLAVVNNTIADDTADAVLTIILYNRTVSPWSVPASAIRVDAVDTEGTVVWQGRAAAVGSLLVEPGGFLGLDIERGDWPATATRLRAVVDETVSADLPLQAP